FHDHLPILHPVDEIIRDGYILQRGGEGFRLQRVAADNIHLFQPCASFQALRVADEYAYAVALFEQARREPSAHIAGRAGDDDEFGGCHRKNCIPPYEIHAMMNDTYAGDESFHITARTLHDPTSAGMDFARL